MQRFAVAIDGPAGSGKSTVAKAIAKRLGIIYVDTGAMYRAVASYCMNKGADTLEAAEIAPLLQEIDLRIELNEGAQKIFLNGEDVTGRIRTQEIGQGASDVGTIEAVREWLGNMQQDMAKRYSVIMDGRDIGTAVLPDAEVKIYLDALVDERTRRRMGELQEKGENPVFEEIKQQIIHRDCTDMNRACRPLRQAEDAVLLDSTTMGVEETVQAVLRIIEEKIKC